jgi:hypothetical protein
MQAIQCYFSIEMAGADMQIRSLEAANSSAIAGLQKSHRTVDAEWAETIEMTLGTESGSTNAAGVKLSELLVAHLLREMMPADSRAEGGLAFDTWRGMLADAIAQEVSPRIDLMSSVIRPDGG